MNSKQTKLAALASAVVLVLLFAGIYLSTRHAGKGAPLPQDFLESRKNAALISQNIADLTNKTDDKIAEANRADLAGDVWTAEQAIEGAQNLNKDANRAAADLAAQLKIMTESLAGMQPENQRLAYEAAATELSLVSEFVVYTQSLNEFLEKLLASMETETKVSKADLAASLKKTNESAKKINTLNAEFGARMKALDSSF